jgi:hypothetical protein
LEKPVGTFNSVEELIIIIAEAPIPIVKIAKSKEKISLEVRYRTPRNIPLEELCEIKHSRGREDFSKTPA